jgi:hypothetical protein
VSQITDPTYRLSRISRDADPLAWSIGVSAACTLLSAEVGIHPAQAERITTPQPEPERHHE